MKFDAAVPAFPFRAPNCARKAGKGPALRNGALGVQAFLEGEGSADARSTAISVDGYRQMRCRGNADKSAAPPDRAET